MENIGRKRHANFDEELRAGEKRPREKAAQQSKKRGSSKTALCTRHSEGEEDRDLRERNNPLEIHNSRQNLKT